ncbi:hypothetical protein HN51_026921 [Arachis hypogaea]|uniref:Homeobox-leucine zipper protein GLABRA n=1 Tax=Arachis hypogaea TaxID=3818 RepID=A0A445BQ10_ARAHY|nr:homeobox-leucine zipper protein GLABRA 2 [Arachis hypogaea]QHO33167.1 Homeobox-leucine zipper protein GLABRA [Arachis hypogaea]RYR40758.1 hypothetical protein Ahy_A09g046486 [Arachis hypogaea]
MGMDMSSNTNKDLFSSPTLSLTLAGIFNNQVEEVGDEGSRECSRKEDTTTTTTVDVSSENSGPLRSRSEDDDDDGDDDDGSKKKKKRRKYHRHTAEQIREMEAVFKESPHPDESQRKQLSKQLGLAPSQVKFWFQNRRTQIKAIQERHESSLLKKEIEKLMEENKAMREAISKSCCPNCGMAMATTSTITDDSSTISIEEQQLRLENAKLKAEVEKLREVSGKYPSAGTIMYPSCSTSHEQVDNNRINSSMDFYNGIFGVEKSRIMEIVNQAIEELIKMATIGEPLWVRSVETGREILNYDEYEKVFEVHNNSRIIGRRSNTSIEASRENGIVFMDLSSLVQSFLDVNQWKEMFPCLISKAANVDVICNGEGSNRNGVVQLMFAELQMLTPMVPTREVYFVRCCRKLSDEKWGIVDVSIDKVEDNIDASLLKCRKRPSGCIIEDKSHGHCKVSWVEHWECEKSSVHRMYRSIVNNGTAFGARHWISTLQLQCQRLVFFMATNVPIKDSTGVATSAGRKSILKLGERMRWSFCHAIGASSFHTWTKVTSKNGEDIRISSRKNLNDPGQPLGVILSAVSSVWLPLPPNVLFHFLRDENHRSQWDIMVTGGSSVQSIATLAKGQDRGNAVNIHEITSKENIKWWILQDSSTNAYESMVVYAPVDIPSMKNVMNGCDSTNIPILPSGFSILPDGVDSRPLITSTTMMQQQQEENMNTEEGGGSLLTMAFQVITNNNSNGSPSSAKLTLESVESVKSLVSCTLRNIKSCLQCEED